MYIVIGLVEILVMFVVFKFMIEKLNLKTPGREDDDSEQAQQEEFPASKLQGHLGQKRCQGQDTDNTDQCTDAGSSGCQENRQAAFAPVGQRESIQRRCGACRRAGNI